MVDYCDYIYPIFVHIADNNNSSRPSLVGNGFVISDYFITAAHIISDNQNQSNKSNPYVIINGNEIELLESNSYKWKTLPYDTMGHPYGHKKPENGDVAIFKITGIQSPLKLSKSLPMYGDTLQCTFFHGLSPQIDAHLNVEDRMPTPVYCWETEGVIFDESGFTGNFLVLRCHHTTQRMAEAVVVPC